MSVNVNEIDKNISERKALDQSGDYGRHQVPAEARRSLFSIMMVTTGYTIAMSGLFTGAAMAIGLTIRDAIIAMIIANVIVVGYSGLCAQIGTRYGTNSTMLARQAFGRNGSKIIGLIIALSLTGWYSFQCGFFGETIATMFTNGGILADPKVAALWGGLLMMITAVVGFKGIEILSNVGVPLLFITLIIGLVFSKRIIDVNGVMPVVLGQEYTIKEAVVMTIGAVAVAGVVQSDISRYAKSTRDCWISTAFGFVVGTTFVMGCGLIFVKTSHNTNLPGAMVSIGLGIIGLIILIISQWTTNDNNLYSSSLALLPIIPNVKRSHIAAVLGIIGTVFGALGIYNFYVSFLTFLGSVIPPISGIIIADYYFVKKREYKFGMNVKYSQWNISSIISLIGGTIVGLKVPIGISSLNGIIAGFLFHIIFSAALKEKAEMGSYYEDETGF